MFKNTTIKSLLSLMLCFAMLFSIVSQPAMAMSKMAEMEDNPTKFAIDIYNNLTPEAKALFQEQLNKDFTLQSFHRQNVGFNDSMYEMRSSRSYSMMSATVANPLDVLNAELVALNLPTAVRYALMAIGSGMAAAGIDGPIPVGDIIGALLAIGGIAVLAFYWDEVSAKWDGIVDAFKTAFEHTKSTIDQAFADIAITVDQYLYPYSVNQDEIKIKADGITIAVEIDRSSNPKYYFAVR